MNRPDFAYTRRFDRHVLDLIKQFNLFPEKGQLVVSVSGGVDSVVLAHVLFRLNIPFSMLHFHHGTRPENEAEESLIHQLAKNYQVAVHVARENFDITQSNFEFKARQWRSEVYRTFQEEKKTIVTAHHLDDSFEWSLMQSAKQGSLEATLGIPVKGPWLARPFMGVSKAHILRYARAADLRWIEDSSNENISFERNYIRKKICVPLKQKYPQYLRHYVAQKNALAMKLGVHVLKTQSELIVKKDISGGRILMSSSMREHKSEIKKWIVHFSQKKRGELDTEIDKLILAHHNIQQEPKSPRIKGPMYFSGGVEVHLCQDHLFIMGSKEKNFYQKLDQNLCESLQKFTQIPFCRTDAFPQLVIGAKELVKKSNLLLHPLLPLTCQYLKDRKISYTFAPVLSPKIRQMIDHSAVILASSDLGL